MTRSAPVNDRPALEALTGLRFIAAMAVVLFHALEALWSRADGHAARLVSHGYLGVSFFFVLSGFILTYTYIDSETGALRGSARDFWWARVARIYPMYCLALVLALPIFGLYRIVLAPAAARVEAMRALILAPALLQAWWPSAACQWNCPGWSLSVEVFFYAVFPLLAVAIARSRRNIWLLGVLSTLACIVIPLAYTALSPTRFAHPTRFDEYTWLAVAKFNPVAHLGEFMMGIVSGLAFLRRGSATSPSATRAALTGGAVLVLGFVLAMNSRLPYLFLHDGLLAPLWAAAIVWLAPGRGITARVLASRPLVRLGESSYALYLVHVPVLGFVVLARGFLRIRHPEWVVPSWVPLIVYLSVAIGLSLSLFTRFEQPARIALRRWRARSRLSASVIAQRPDLQYVGLTGE